MFDTVRLKVRPVAIDSGILNQLTSNAITFLSKETAGGTEFIKYYSNVIFIKNMMLRGLRILYRFYNWEKGNVEYE